MFSKILTSSHEIDMARRLVYKIYVEEGGWTPSLDNPSGLKVLKFPDSTPPMIIDRFDPYSTWVGVFDEARAEPVACGRISSRDQYGKFEIQYYDDTISNLEQIDLKLNPNVFVLNRTAILSEYRGTAAWLILLRQGFAYCHEQKHAAFSGTSVEKVQRVHDSIGYPCVEGLSFQYEISGENYAKVYHATYPDDTCRVIENLDTLIDKKIKKDNGEFMTSTLSAKL